MDRLIKVIAIMSIIATIASFFACSKREIKNIDTTTSIKFSSLTQDEKQKYVKDYLSKTYSITCELTEIKRRQVTAIKNEKDYYSVATTNDNYWFSVWITADGEIFETEFTYEIKDEINGFIKELLLQENIVCDVIDRIVFDTPASKVWSSNEISNMFETEQIENNIHLYNIDENVTETEIIHALGNIKGAVYIHYKDNTDFGTYDKFIDLN